MPAFFLLNGFTSNFDKPFKSFIWGSFKALIIPYIAFALIGKFFNAVLWGETDLWVKTVGVGDQTWLFMEESYWFLSALFLARIMYWVIRKFLGNNYCRGAAALLLLLLGFFCFHLYDGQSLSPEHYNNHLHYRQALCLTFFIWLGDFWKHKQALHRYLPWTAMSYIVVVVATKIIGTGCIVPLTHCVDATYHRILFFLFYATTGSLCMMWLSQKIKANKVIEYLGKGSLVVYMVHFAYLIVLCKYLPTYLNPYETPTAIIYFFTVLTLTALLSAATIWLFNQKYLKILIGKF